MLLGGVRLFDTASALLGEVPLRVSAPLWRKLSMSSRLFHL